MDCQPINIDIQTIVTRIRDNDINLQPDFQRGEVWSLNKKKKLIDSLLRNWDIPPIHVVDDGTGIDEVLDGQQRLVSIRDFCNNEYCVDGMIKPADRHIEELDGLYYDDLPVEIRRAFNKRYITVVRLTNYKAEEPAELFYRLNQPVPLTAAEQRNAYVGQTRSQVKALVYLFESLGANKETIGFSNSRLAYDEIISKFATMVEAKSLKKKITAGIVSDRYRNDNPFSDDTVMQVKSVLVKLMNSLHYAETSIRIKLSKATLLSWLVFFKAHNNIEYLDEHTLGTLVFEFEILREFFKGKSLDLFAYQLIEKYDRSYLEPMINVYNQRASMGSTDALSIIYRDIIINIFFSLFAHKQDKLVWLANEAYAEKNSFAYVLDVINSECDWGANF